MAGLEEGQCADEECASVASTDDWFPPELTLTLTGSREGGEGWVSVHWQGRQISFKDIGNGDRRGLAQCRFMALKEGGEETEETLLGVVRALFEQPGRGNHHPLDRVLRSIQEGARRKSRVRREGEGERERGRWSGD